MDAAVGGLDGSPVGDWHSPLGPVFMCPSPGFVAPEPCECGFVGEWEWRHWYVWADDPGHRRSARACQRDAARGWPPRPHDEGWWCIGGSDERCPGCGDVERFDLADHALVATGAERPAVLRLVP